MSFKGEVVVIGAGVVGLSIAKSLLESNNGITVTILEKESEIGMHSSGRNSGVLHAGFYYSPDSLKARFCREGNHQLRMHCEEFQLPIREFGKVVVSRSQEEDLHLEALFNRGIENGIKLELLDQKELADLEPLARTFRRFIWSPTTAVADPVRVLATLKTKVENLGGKIVFNSKYDSRITYSKLVDNQAIHVINASGSQADRIAKSFGFGKQFVMVPFMGLYRYVSPEKFPLKRLVYPVPNPKNPFLGVHFTITESGKVKIGPTAIPLLNREQYSLFENWNLTDMKESIEGMHSMYRGNTHDIHKLIRTEVPKFSKSQLIRDAATLVPISTQISGWQKMKPGIRAQLVNIENGELASDFIVEGDSQSTHILNAVSPGWTAALPFGKFIADQVLSKLV